MGDVNISYEMENIDIDKLIQTKPEINIFENQKDIQENFEYEDSNYAYYLMLDALGDDTLIEKHRTLYDAYWTRFYNEKAESYDTDLIALRFV